MNRQTKEDIKLALVILPIIFVILYIGMSLITCLQTAQYKYQTSMQKFEDAIIYYCYHS